MSTRSSCWKAVAAPLGSRHSKLLKTRRYAADLARSEQGLPMPFFKDKADAYRKMGEKAAADSAKAMPKPGSLPEVLPKARLTVRIESNTIPDLNITKTFEPGFHENAAEFARRYMDASKACHKAVGSIHLP